LFFHRGTKRLSSNNRNAGALAATGKGNGDQEARVAAVQVAIQDELDRLLNVYDAELYKRVRVFEHVFETYEAGPEPMWDRGAELSHLHLLFFGGP
jgi:hypothetical protein